MEVIIDNITDLRAEIERLKFDVAVQEIVIKKHFESPSAIFSTIRGLFSNPADKSKAGGLLGGQDVLSLISRFVLPFVLNKTLFRGSNFIIKAIVGLVSQKASGFINEKSVTSLWDKVKGIIPGKKPKKRHIDYGIPPYSETY